MALVASDMSCMCCAARLNITVVRIFAFGVQEGYNLQVAPGKHNETFFRGLDAVIAEAGKHGLRLVVTLANNWAYNSNASDWKCTTTPHASPLYKSSCLHAILRKGPA